MNSQQKTKKLRELSKLIRELTEESGDVAIHCFYSEGWGGDLAYCMGIDYKKGPTHKCLSDSFFIR